MHHCVAKNKNQRIHCFCESRASGGEDSAAERALLQCSSALWEITVLRERGSPETHPIIWQEASKEVSPRARWRETARERRSQKHRCQREEEDKEEEEEEEQEEEEEEESSDNRM